MLPTVVEEILPTGFIDDEEEGKALPADKFVASRRQLFVLGSWTPYITHIKVSVCNVIVSSLGEICASLTSPVTCVFLETLTSS